MKLFSDCSGDCLDCQAYYTVANCLAGHGDDYFSPINENTAKKVLSDGVLNKGMNGPLYDERPLTQEEKDHLIKACGLESSLD